MSEPREPQRIELNLLGQTLTIRSEASPNYLRTLAKYLEQRVTALKQSGVKDAQTALALAALDITDELFRAREDKTRDEGDVGARLGALVAILEKVAPREPGPAPARRRLAPFAVSTTALLQLASWLCAGPHAIRAQNLPWRPAPEAKRWAPATASPVLNDATPSACSRRSAAGSFAPSDS